MILHTSLQWLRQNIYHSFSPQKTPHTSWWHHQMETFSALLALCAWNSLVTGEFPSQRPETQSLDVFFDLSWIKGWVNNPEAGDLRRHHAHNDVIVMLTLAGELWGVIYEDFVENWPRYYGTILYLEKTLHSSPIGARNGVSFGTS